MKKFIIGLILGAGLMFSMSSYAEEVTNYVGSVIEGQFPVKVNGQQIAEPGLVVNGISYLPTRKIAEIFNAEVKFDTDLGIELIPNQVTTTTQTTTESPEVVRYREVSKEIVRLMNEKGNVEDEINLIKTAHENVDEKSIDPSLFQQVADYDAQISALQAEKKALEAQIFNK